MQNRPDILRITKIEIIEPLSKSNTGEIITNGVSVNDKHIYQ